MSAPNIVGKRLREARGRTQYSQKALGIAAGFDPFSASPRINHYEQGRHQPNFDIIRILAKLLEVPTAYFYAEEDEIADLILAYSKLPKKSRQSLMSQLRNKPTDSRV
jgi:transcriptional regulator with XRE-family HTH domain